MTAARAILTVLDRVHPYLMPEMSLWADANLQLSVPLTLTEFRASLSSLEQRRLLLSLRDDIDGVTRWRITDNGRAAVMQ
jgi:hypothetical protein